MSNETDPPSIFEFFVVVVAVVAICLAMWAHNQMESFDEDKIN